ncbi:hypothetical protein LBMAG42_01670 [Deltaproteobacteria bacterium]|nr:hypothetical protein LBMAG42_01670 [Deltaproteobacteria bacterium]
MVLLVGLLACETEPADSGPAAEEAHYWDGLEVPLDPFRLMLEVQVDTSPAAHLASISTVPLLAAWPQREGGAALLDARYRLADDFSCLDAAPFVDVLDGADRHGRCAEGLVELDRTHLANRETILAVVDEPAMSRLSVLLEGGRVRSANTDLLTGNPFDWLRLCEDEVLLASDGVPATLLVADGAGGWFGVAGSWLVRWDGAGAVVSELPLPEASAALVASGGRAWASSRTGLVRDDGIFADLVGVRGMVSDGGGGVFAVVQDAALAVGADGALGDPVPVTGATGPIARDERSGRLYVAVDEGIAVVSGGAEIDRYAVEGVIDVAVNGSSEISVLDASGAVHVFVDETSLSGPTPLRAWVATFIENPRQVATIVDCSGTDEGMVERLDRAIANRSWLDDVPASVALAVSPASAAHAKRCKVTDELVEVTTGGRVTPGVLFHDPPDCSDQRCLDAGVAADLKLITELGIAPQWMSGAAGWDAGGDWVLALAALDMPAVHAFVGLTALPTIGYDDPRAKDALPWAGEAEVAPWRARDATTAGVDDPEGVLALLPGSTMSVFNLAGCPGLLQAECRLLALGGGDAVAEDDLAVADLLLHRAAAHRSESGGDTWYFHLPAIEEFDYTDGCSHDGDRWTGEGCEAGLLQGWLVDVQERLVMAEVVAWSAP